MRWRIPIIAALALFVAVSCDQQPVAPTSDQAVAGVPLFAVGPVVHHASLAGNDVCEALGLPPGCDANFSLVANAYADGSVKGQWQDTFSGGGGVHVAVDCLIVYGNQAVVGGVVTKFDDPALVGTRAITSVVDNGTSANDDNDQLSFSFFGFGPNFGCDVPAPGDFPLFDLGNGQVKVW